MVRSIACSGIMPWSRRDSALGDQRGNGRFGPFLLQDYQVCLYETKAVAPVAAAYELLLLYTPGVTTVCVKTL